MNGPQTVNPSRIDSVTITNSPTPYASSSSERLAIYLAAHTSDTITYSNDPAVAVNGGIVVGPNSGGLLVAIDDYGDCVQKAWFAVSSAASSVVGRVEVFEQRNVNTGKWYKRNPNG